MELDPALGVPRVRSIMNRPEIPPLAQTPGGERVTAISAPPHIAAPANSKPFYVFGTVALAAAAVRSVVATIQVPSGMVGRVSFIEQQVTNFSAGLLDDMIEWQLAYDEIGVAPYVVFRGTLSRRDFPKRGLVVDPASGETVISLRARVLPTAEGGLDLATALAYGSIAGWFEPLRQTA